MNAIETTGIVDAEGKLHLDEPIRLSGPGPVRVILLFEDDAIEEQEWLQAASQSSAFTFLNDPAEDLYSAEDGHPFNR
jgi:hypothetical protein